MTTLAIIGSGIGGRSLIYTLAKEKKAFTEIIIFGSESFAKACSYRSTAVVAPRGLSEGHSELGDLLYKSYADFKEHFELDHPLGVEKVKQVTGGDKVRYPHGKMSSDFSHDEIYLQEDEAFLIDPKTYLDFLLSKAQEFYGEKLKVMDDFVLETYADGRIKTHQGAEFQVDKIVHASGVYNRYWTAIAPDSKLKSIKASQGSYIEFNDLKIERDSFSITLNGHNYIWNKKEKRLLIGSTTLEVNHEIPPLKELTEIQHFFKTVLTLEVPEIASGKVQVGLREKAQKRSPYYFQEGKRAFMGGFYKNGYTLGLAISKRLSELFL